MRYAILCLFFSLAGSLLTQVGVNIKNPTQALHVDGKIRVGDDTTAPDKGTIRFNDSTDEFEGYNGMGSAVPGKNRGSAI